ncbi:phospholipase [Rhodobacterales bacterium HKCCE3408]|nr:phospholipase [Rhodobacterales bacterium HKCCE3408]
MTDETDDTDLSTGPAGLRVLITAGEAYPEMERAFLAAEREIWASFRVFDLSTRLRSQEGREIGETWFDLVVHLLERGIALHVALSDFDPIMVPNLHCMSWQARRAFIAAGEIAGPGAKLDLANAVHSVRVGYLPRLLLWPMIVKRIAGRARHLNAQTASERALTLRCSPGLRPWLKEKPGGTLVARKWPPPPLLPGTHHQKIAVVDRDLLLIGGLDLNERRYDDKTHRRPASETWSDVQLVCRGAIALDAQRHLESFLPAVAGRIDPPDTGRILRTLSRRRRFQVPFIGPRPLRDELAEAHLRLLGEVRHHIYLETQFFRDRRLADALAKAAETQPGLGLTMVLPGAPEDVAFDGAQSSDARFGEYLQAECLDRVCAAFGDRAVISSPVVPERAPGTGRDTLCGSPIIYVHSKVSIFDDRRAIVSSANLNARSLRWDTEAGIVLGEEDVPGLRRRVFGHWFGKDGVGAVGEPENAVDAWRRIVEENGTAAPEDRTGYLVPHDRRPARAFGRPMPFLPDAMV